MQHWLANCQSRNPIFILGDQKYSFGVNGKEYIKHWIRILLELDQNYFGTTSKSFDYNHFENGSDLLRSYIFLPFVVIKAKIENNILQAEDLTRDEKASL